MPTKSAVAHTSDDLLAEYDLSQLTGGVRGKYYERATAGTTLVLLDPDVAEAFPDGRTVNQALRALVTVAKSHVRTAEVGASRTLATASPTRRRAKSKSRRRAARVK